MAPFFKNNVRRDRKVYTQTSVYKSCKLTINYTYTLYNKVIIDLLLENMLKYISAYISLNICL